jgi:uncharacterized delta-60 repeat protein
MRNFGLLTLACACALVLPAAAAANPADVDTTFGSGGTVTLADVAKDSGSVIDALQADGTRIVGFDSASNQATLIRLNAAGQQDGGFGTGGRLTLPLGAGASSYVSKILVAPDKHVYVLGEVTVGGNQLTAVWALKGDGTLETGFEGDGLRILPYIGTSNNIPGGFGLQPDGTLAVVFHTVEAAVDNVRVSRVNPVGSVISSTATPSGSVTTDFQIGGVVVQPSGRILVGITANSSSSGQFELDVLGYKSDGTGLDTTFAPSSGVVSVGYMIPMFSFMTGLVGSADGSVAAIGSIGYVPSVTFVNPSGVKLPLHGAFGAHRLLPYGELGLGTNGLFLKSGKLLYLGYGAKPDGTGRSFLSRFNADGSDDAAFGSGGTALLGTANGGSTALLQQADGKYLLTSVNNNGDIITTRFWGDFPVVPVSVAFGASLKSKLKASKAKTIAGSANGTFLSRVELAIQKVDGKLLKKSKKCAFVKSPKGATTNVKAVKGKCAPAAWLAATGTGSWSYKLTKALKPGKYVFSVRAAGSDGTFSAVAKKTVKIVK